MNLQAEALKQRTKRFALAVLAQVRKLPSSDEARIVGRQLLRAGTSAGANYRACCRSRSRREFISRIGVVLEEVDEGAFWIELLIEGRIVPMKNDWQELLNEANQLAAIFAQSRLTAAKRLTRERRARRELLRVQRYGGEGAQHQ